MTDKPNLHGMNVADQCRALGLDVGDTIEGVDYGSAVRLTLLFVGDECAVWRVTERFKNKRGWKSWTKPEESADWTLEFRDWKRVNVDA